jgi:hypothetical protein
MSRRVSSPLAEVEPILSASKERTRARTKTAQNFKSKTRLSNQA